jgi:hypothetical protein
MSSSQNIIIRYEGESLNNGEMDIRDFASSLLSFGNYLQEAHNVLHGTEHTLSVRVKSNFERGSFIVGLELAQTPIQEIVNLLSGQGSSALSNFLQIVGGVGTAVGSVLYIIRKIKNRKHQTLDISNGNVRIIIENANTDGTTEEYIVPRQAYMLAVNKKVRGFVDGFVQPLGKSGVSAIEIGGTARVESTRIEKEEYEAFTLPGETQQSIVSEVVTFVQIISPTFKRDNKWKFRINGNEVTAKISDKAFIERVLNGYESFTSKTVLKVNLRTTANLTMSNELKYEYEILQVVERLNQQALFDTPEENEETEENQS